MLGMVIIVGVAGAVGLLRRAPLPVPRWWWLGLLAAVPQLLPVFHQQADWLLRVSYALLLLVAWHNRDRIGGWVLVAGLACNALPIMAYGRMPISSALLHQYGLDLSTGTILTASKDIVLDASPLLFLGDTLPVHIGSYHSIWSIGDVLLCAGVLLYVCFATEREADPTSNQVHAV